MLKLIYERFTIMPVTQPPSGGCVLKHPLVDLCRCFPDPAAFGRLCVETFFTAFANSRNPPAAFGRLCVETPLAILLINS